jgi:FMNH2-dependent dimethyl sulfone monooxygenase
MSAGSSGAGSHFARRWADANFIAVPDLEKCAQIVDKARADARAVGRDIGLYTNAWIVCRDTEREALDYVDHVIQAHGDWAQANLNIEEMVKNSHSIGVFEKKALAARAMQGFFSLPLIGTPEQIVSRMVKISEAGLDGLALSWVDYHAGLAQFKRDLLPLMIEAGLRVA